MVSQLAEFEAWVLVCTAYHALHVLLLIKSEIFSCVLFFLGSFDMLH